MRHRRQILLPAASVAVLLCCAVFSPLREREAVAAGESKALKHVVSGGTKSGATTRKTRKAKRGAHDLDARLAGLDHVRYQQNITDLVAFGTRYTTSPGCDAARDYLVRRFSEMGLRTETQAFPVGPRQGANVIATLPGTSDPDGTGDFVLLGAHYDSIARDADPLTVAPGAEDNASGVSALLELAALLRADRPRTTVVFVAFSGEEENLWGSTKYVEVLQASNRASRLRAALILDMIGFTADDDLDILFETDRRHTILTRRPVALAADYTGLRCETSTSPFGSDHVPFLNAGLPAMLAIENDWDAYPAYHRSTDLPGLISPEMAREALRVITAWTLDMANLTDTPATISSVKVVNGALTIDGGRFRKDDQVVVEGTLLDAPKASKAGADGIFNRLRVKDDRIATIFQSGKTLRIEVVHPETGVRSKAFSFKF